MNLTELSSTLNTLTTLIHRREAITTGRMDGDQSIKLEEEKKLLHPLRREFLKEAHKMVDSIKQEPGSIEGWDDGL